MGGEQWIERTFRFIEMIGITALLKAVLVPAYPIIGGILVGVLGALASAYLVSPLADYSFECLTKEAKSRQPIIAAAIVTGLLFLLIQLVWLQPLVARTSDLIKTTIAAPPCKAVPHK